MLLWWLRSMSTSCLHADAAHPADAKRPAFAGAAVLIKGFPQIPTAYRNSGWAGARRRRTGLKARIACCFF